MGADPIALAATMESIDFGMPLQAFVVRKDGPKKHGLGKEIEGLAEPAGVQVVIVDDVCTKGDSTVQAVVKARAAGMEVLGAICLVDREAGAAETLQQHDCALHSIFRLSELIARKKALAGAA